MRRDMPVGQVMGSADAALALAESRGDFAVELGVPGDRATPDTITLGENTWRKRINEALVHGRMKLVTFPVIASHGGLIHLECPLRIQLDPQGPYETAARWLPLALRSRLTASIDERAVELALADIASDGMPRCVNLSSASLADSAFAARLRSRLLDAPIPARSLWLEVPEIAAVEQFAQVQELAHQLRPIGARVGLEHVGERLARIERLFEAGIDYVKLDASAVQRIAGDDGRINYLKSVVTMLHGLSIKAFAEGVFDAADAQALWSIGVDGVTGPWASETRKDLVT
jgi:EAL domain-containing protein (putative c-di-GMP-specific phosphodiesterase class I)